MPRISVKAHHQQFLENIAQQMGTDQTTALDFILWNVKMQGFSFASGLSALPSTPSAPMPPESIGAFVPYQEVAPPTAPTVAESLDQHQDDEIVLKFVGLLEEF